MVTWLVSIGLAAPLFIFHDLSTESVLGKPVFHTCIEIWPHDRFRETYSIIVSLIQYLAPTIVISGLHARICNFLRRRIHDSPTSESQVRIVRFCKGWWWGVALDLCWGVGVGCGRTPLYKRDKMALNFPHFYGKVSHGRQK